MEDLFKKLICFIRINDIPFSIFQLDSNNIEIHYSSKEELEDIKIIKIAESQTDSNWKIINKRIQKEHVGLSVKIKLEKNQETQTV